MEIPNPGPGPNHLESSKLAYSGDYHLFPFPDRQGHTFRILTVEYVFDLDE